MAEAPEQKNRRLQTKLHVKDRFLRRLEEENTRLRETIEKLQTQLNDVCVALREARKFKQRAEYLYKQQRTENEVLQERLPTKNRLPPVAHAHKKGTNDPDENEENIQVECKKKRPLCEDLENAQDIMGCVMKRFASLKSVVASTNNVDKSLDELRRHIRLTTESFHPYKALLDLQHVTDVAKMFDDHRQEKFASVLRNYRMYVDMPGVEGLLQDMLRGLTMDEPREKRLGKWANPLPRHA